MESLTACPECSGQVSSTSAFCSQCGSPTGNSANRTGARGGNVLGKLWRGEYSLPLTYWGFGWLAGIAYVVLSTLLNTAGVDTGIIGMSGLAMLAYSVVAMVGIWRSAGRYAGPRIWAVLARVAVVITTLRVVAALLVGFE